MASTLNMVSIGLLMFLLDIFGLEFSKKVHKYISTCSETAFAVILISNLYIIITLLESVLKH